MEMHAVRFVRLMYFVKAHVFIIYVGSKAYRDRKTSSYAASKAMDENVTLFETERATVNLPQ
ncbi:MAG: hypothetical protein R3A12_03270 [Ignavibacteria bacterium]